MRLQPVLCYGSFALKRLLSQVLRIMSPNSRTKPKRISSIRIRILPRYNKFLSRNNRSVCSHRLGWRNKQTNKQRHENWQIYHRFINLPEA